MSMVNGRKYNYKIIITKTAGNSPLLSVSDLWRRFLCAMTIAVSCASLQGFFALADNRQAVP
ncbi:MAG: hypothetical protein ABIL58_02515 [Pseudomonadota bacterium]